jgi:hypothetical protein
MASIQYAEDPKVLDYLMRSAKRLRSEDGIGFALLSADGIPVHFCWAKDFEGFEMAELNRALQAPCADAVMIFDCYTPASARGQGFFTSAIAALADRLCSEGKGPWIFGAATNQMSLLGIEKSGFTHQFTLGRKRVFFFEKAKDSMPSSKSPTISKPVAAP